MTGVEVLINLPSIKFNKGYWYCVPDKLEDQVEEGKRVIVQIGKLMHEGYIVAVEQNCLKVGLKPVVKILDEVSVFDQRLLELAGWMAEYYVCPVSLALKAMIPKLLSKKKSWVIIPAVSREEFVNINLEININMELMERLWAEGEMSFSTALKYTTRSQLKDMETDGLIINTGSYKVRQQFKAGYVYAIQQFDYAKDMPVLSKRASRQAEIMELITNKGQVKCEHLDKCYARATINSLINKGYLKIEKKVIQQIDTKLVLTQEQEKALNIINKKIEAGNYEEILLYGVTGSGKTEVYIKAAEQTIKQGKGVIVLVPEIALTRHLVSSFNARFRNMAVLHSGMPPGERHDEWKRIKNGEVDLVLGTRSAIFAPLPAIGLIIIDEEQETTYKQEESPRYHAREVAVRRAQMDSAVFLAGSATPSVDTFYKAMNGKMTLVTIKERIGEAKLPRVTVEDLRKSFHNGEKNIISPYLQEKIEQTLNRGEQTILFINRRGYAPITICMQCGSIASCPDCSVALTYHQDIDQNVCHYCDYRANIPNLCPVCGSTHIQQIGFGTQKLEEQVHSLFPGSRIIRLDRDTSTKKGAQNTILEEMKKHQIDI
ncbi:MAG: primosomal protein N', partial [Syntrophomonas sp.]